MFNPSTDERLRFVNYKAGFYGFIATSFLLLAANAVEAFMNTPERINHTMLMFFPWFVGVSVYVILLLRSGYTSAVREEATRTPAGLRNARISVLLGTVLFASLMFAIRRIFPSAEGSGSLETDAFSSMGAAILFGLWGWWFQARKPKIDADETVVQK